MEASKLLPFSAMYSLLAKTWNVIAEYAHDMVIRDKLNITLILSRDLSK